MNFNSSRSPINSHDEWTRLEETIVGTPYHVDYHNDTSFKLFFHDNIMSASSRGVFGRAKPSNRLKEECEEDLDGFLRILDECRVSVRRPEILDSVPEVKTPYWSAPMGHALMSRDLFLIVGDEIIETAPMVRARYFEGDLYKELFTEYFEKGARWSVAPRSRLMDQNFDYSYVRSKGYDEAVPSHASFEIMFDGAQVLRIGKDLLFNVSTENHRMGARWLARHLGNAYRVHTVEITDNHIDAMLLPLRPGTFLARDIVDRSELPAPFRDWEIVWYQWLEEPIEVEEDGVPLLASQSIGMNVLSIDEERVIVQDIQVPLMRSLEKAGFTPIPCRWRHGRSLGGGFHCVTLDTVRAGELTSYA